MRRQLGLALFALLFSGAWLVHPASALAQGPPAGPPGRGPVVLEGELEAIYEDDENTGRLLHFLHSQNRRIPLRFQDGRMPDLPTGARVRVAGDLADDGLTATSVTTLAASTTETLGHQNILVILFNFASDPTQPFSPTTVATVNDKVRNYYLENTYGQTFMNFTVAGWFTIDASTATCDYYAWATAAESAATSAGYNLASYNRRVFAFPRTSGCGWSGMGNVRGPRSWVNGSYTVRTMAHEQGHNFGNLHSKAMKCEPSGCKSAEYGDDRDVMGKAAEGHMNAYQKERLGWLNSGSSPAIQTVSSSGDYWIENYENISGGHPKALKIWNSATSSYLYVESRAAVGFDAHIAAGVTLHSTVGGSHQIDLDPATTAYESRLDMGQIFSDGALSIETLSTELAGAMIRVSLGGGGTPCTKAPPAISLSSSAPTAYTVTVTNRNSSTCSASAFSLAAAVPSGWSAAFSPSSISSLAPGASASSTLTLAAPAGASGTFSFGVTATDMSAGYSGSATGSLTIAGTTCTKEEPAVSLSSGGPMVYTMTVTNRNSSTCSASAFSLAAALPSGWSAAFSPSSISSLAPGASASSTVTLAAPAGASGTFSFGVTATDMSAGYAGSATGSLTIAAASLNVTVSGTVTGGGRERTLTIKVTAKLGTQAVRNAAASAVVTNPLGGTMTISGLTNGDGTANLKSTLRYEGSTGVYQILATVTSHGMTASAITSVKVQ